MNKVVYNDSFGGFSLSKKAVEWLAENGREEIKPIINEELRKYPNDNCYFLYGIQRHDPDLVRCVETLGRAAEGDGGFVTSLSVHELKGNKYRIDFYDGLEHVIELEDEEYITIK